MRAGYKQTEIGIIPSDWEVKSIFQVAPLQRGFDLPTREIKIGPFPVVYSNGVENFHKIAMATGPGVVTGRSGTLGKVHFIESDYWPHNTSLWVTRFNENDPKFIYYFYKSLRFERFTAGSGVPTLNRNVVHSYRIALPKNKSEQKKIAQALSDVDSLLGGLKQLITKKRNLKQAIMQQLLTGQIRLSGFNKKWEEKTLVEIAVISKGVQLHTTETKIDGHFPHYNGGIHPSSFTDRSNTPANTIAISEGGNSCGFVHFISKPFWCGGHCYAVIPNSVDNNFLFYALKGLQKEIMKLRVGSGLPNIQKTTLGLFKLKVPKNPVEQKAIAIILFDIDVELTALEARHDKTQELKKGMMQELLTGKTRLVKLGAAHA